MKIAVMYVSNTGNTKLIADEIAKALSKEVIYCGEPNKQVEADLYFVGSWTDKGDFALKAKEFLANLENKKLAIFGTAGFGGSLDYFNTLYTRAIKDVSASNQILGYFYTQGKMPLAVRNRYEALIKANPLDEKLQVSLKNFDEALMHPNQSDLNAAASFALEIRKKLS